MVYSDVVVIPTAPPADFADLIHRERKELLDLLASLEAQDWFLPSTCPGWSVLDLAVHLVGVDLGVLARDRDRNYGTAVPEDVDSEAEFVAFIDELNEVWVRAGRRLSPHLTMDLLKWTGSQLVDLYRHQDLGAMTASVSWASDRPVPKWLDQGRELTERWVHHQHIRHGLGLASWLDPEMTGAVLDVFSWAYPLPPEAGVGARRDLGDRAPHGGPSLASGGSPLTGPGGSGQRARMGRNRVSSARWTPTSPGDSSPTGSPPPSCPPRRRTRIRT